jgi:hypothetical protein
MTCASQDTTATGRRRASERLPSSEARGIPSPTVITDRQTLSILTSEGQVDMLPTALANNPARIGQYNTVAKLRALWEILDAGDAPRGWTAGAAFEYLVVQAFRLNGMRTHWPYRVPGVDGSREVVEQVDGLVWLDSVCFMIESKNEAARVDFDPIAKLTVRMMRRPSSMVGVLVSRIGFTEPAKIMARFLSPQTVLLWEGSELGYALRNDDGMREALSQKYEAAHKYAMPDFNIMAPDLAL